MTLFCGFDPGIAQPGFAVVRRTEDGYAVVEARSISTDPKADLVVRIGAIWDQLSELLRAHAPELLAIERQSQVMAAARFGHGGYNASNDKTHVTVGAAIGCARAYRVACIEVAPVTVKIAVLGAGSRSASKAEVQAAVQRLTGAKLSQARADAVAIAISGAQRASLLERKTG